MRSLLLAVLLCGCGRVDFTGIWSGDMTVSTNCGSNRTLPVQWSMIQQDDTLAITPSGTCGNYTADVQGNFATIRAKACPSGITISGGRLELLSAQKVDALLQATDGANCGATYKGVLTLE
jgi:hypothetical protein